MRFHGHRLFEPAGDVHDDCRVDLDNLAVMASNRLTDCGLDPTDPRAAAKIIQHLTATVSGSRTSPLTGYHLGPSGQLRSPGPQNLTCSHRLCRLQ